MREMDYITSLCNISTERGRYYVGLARLWL